MYYLDSKYQNAREWNKTYTIIFNVWVIFSEEKDLCVLSNSKIRTFCNNTPIDITEQELKDYNKEDIEKLNSKTFLYND